ncbi:hypothetical protein PG995_004842 [Apiospora arundinis]
MAHTKAQKDKVRKSGLSLQNKTKDLGRYCDVFSTLAYWNPTHERMETAMHAPRGQRVPDLNRIFRRSAACHAGPSHGRATRSSGQVEAIHFEAQADASDDANAVAGIDSDADAEYETDPEYVAAVPAAAVEPLSVYDIIPDEDDGTVIPNSPMRQKGPRQLPSPRRPQAGTPGPQPTVERQPARTEPSSTTNTAPTAATNAGARPAPTRYPDNGAMDASLQRAKDGLCTRFPTEIILRHNSAMTEIVAGIQPHSSRSYEVQKALRAYRRTLTNMSEHSTIIEEVLALMQIRGYGNDTSGNAFANDVLRIEVTGETGLNLTIVDLPGLISVANEEQTEYDIQVVRAMVESYVGSSRAIVLAMIQATNDIANQVIVQLARQHDPEGRRTVGIITKPDLINEGGEANLAILATNQANIKLNLGFFMNPVWQQHNLDMSRVGVEKLRLFLQDLLDTHIEKELPKVVTKR